MIPDTIFKHHKVGVKMAFKSFVVHRTLKAGRRSQGCQAAKILVK